MGLLVGLIESDLALHQMKKGGPYKKSTVIFVERRRTSNYLALFLLQNGYDFEPMNADYTLDDNENTLHRMKAGQIQGVVATNKLARGQDIPEVDHVIIYEMSADFSDYKHRLVQIGRTGRMGRGGRSTVMLSRKADRALVVPLVEFMIYHNQVLPYWLWYLYYQKGDYETERDGESSESFVSAVSELPSESESDDNDSLVCSRRNSIP
uniref:Helicase C-terminal domain-containing protein n=1 Tax=Angiostrongylus cantonensis TaxID=6313 RepID=A0A0K0CWE9_ANGCA